MPRYFYAAKSFKGEEKSGVLEAKDERELSRIIRESGYVLVSAFLDEKGKKRGVGRIVLPFLNRVSLVDKIIFTRNLRVMVGAGISLTRALSILGLQARSKKMKNVLTAVAEEINKGKNFSESLKISPDIFPDIFQSMIKVGEETGTLETALKNLTKQMEREYELRSKIKGAMIYPAVIVSAMIAIGILMLIAVVPKLAETFRELNVELPYTTRIVVWLGSFLAKSWPAAILIIIGFSFLLKLSVKTKAGKKSIDTLILKIPVISSVVKKTASAYTMRTLSSLFGAGVPVVKSLEILSAALGNVYYKEAIRSAIEKVEKGEKLSEALKPYQNIYSPMIVQMIEVGEETGETAEILDKLADFFEEEVSNAAKNLTAVVEPVLMLIVGAAVGFFAISMVQPIYSMLGAIK